MMDSNKKINYESAQKVKDYLKNGNAGKLYTFTNFFIKNGYIKSESEVLKIVVTDTTVEIITTTEHDNVMGMDTECQALAKLWFLLE